MHYEYMYKKLSSRRFGLEIERNRISLFWHVRHQYPFCVFEKKNVRPFIDSHRFYLKRSTENDYGNLQIGSFYVLMQITQKKT